MRFQILLLASLATISFTASWKPAAARIKIPDGKVISTYDPDAIATTPNEGSESAGSSPNTAFTNADLSRLGVVSRSYPKTIQIMRSVLTAIRANSPDQAINPQIQIFNSPLPEGRALSRDLIVVSTGFFDVLETEFENKEQRLNALAYLLAHEYAHLLYNHPATYQKQLEQTKISNSISKGYAVLKSVQSTHYQISGSSSAQSNKAYFQAEKIFMGAQIASPWIEAELYRAVYAPYRKKEEQLADFMATDLLLDNDDKTDSFDAKQGAAPLRAIYETYDEKEKTALKALAKDTETTMSKAASDMVAVTPAALLSNPESLGHTMKQRLKAAAFEIGGRTLLRRLNTSKVHLYNSADGRVDAIDTYADKFYPALEKRLSLGSLSKLNIVTAYKAENTPTAAARQAMILLAQGDISGAAKSLASVNKSKGLKNITYLMASASVAFAQGNLDLAIAHYRAAIRRDDAPVRAYSGLSKAHLRKGNDNKTIEALDIGAKRFSEKDFIVARINAFVTLGRNEDALATLAICETYSDKALVKKCKRAASPAQPIESEDTGIDQITGVIGDGILGRLRRK